MKKPPAKREKPSPTKRVTKKSVAGTQVLNSRTDAAVETLLRELSHPLKQEIEKARALILDIDPSISEAIKWNTVSFRTTDFFAAVNLRCKDSLQFVFHTGAKVKATAKTGIDIQDPAELCKWLAKDRCLVTLGSGAEIDANRKAFEALVREWIQWV